MALIALFAPMARSTNRSTAAAPDPIVLLLYVTSPTASACIRASELVGRGSDGFTARRPYPRPMPLTSTYAVRGSVPSRRCASAHWACSIDGGGKTRGRDRWKRLRRPSARLLVSDLAFQDACSLPSSPSSLDSDPGRVSWMPRASVMRLLVASEWPSMQ
jgi:hypothetical protein